MPFNGRTKVTYFSVKTTTQKKYFSIYFMTFPHKFCTKRNLSKADTSSLLHPFRNKE